jgi:sugar lactone lactonase YvrE
VTRTLQPDVALAAQASLAEGPLWDDRTSTLVFIDIDRGEVHRFDPSSDRLDTFGTGETLGTAVLDGDGGFVLAGTRHLLRCDANGAGLAPVPGTDVTGEVRFNDGKVDPWGRLVVGTNDLQFHRPIAALHRLDPDGSFRTLIEGVTISNGLDWSADGRTFFYADSGTKRVDAIDLDDEGELRLDTRRTAVSFDDGRVGGPDGLCLDAEGGIWVACWSRGAVHRYTPAGALDVVVPLPVRAATSVGFGGADLGDLYITTGTYAEGGDGSPEPHAGDVFVVRPGVVGRPPDRFGVSR